MINRILPVFNTAESIPAPNRLSDVVDPSYARPRAAVTVDKSLPVPALISIASFNAPVASSTSFVDLRSRSIAGRNSSSATPYCRCIASIMPSTGLVSCASPRFVIVCASFAAAFSSAIAACTPSIIILAASPATATPATPAAAPTIEKDLDIPPDAAAVCVCAAAIFAWKSLISPTRRTTTGGMKSITAAPHLASRPATTPQTPCTPHPATLLTLGPCTGERAGSRHPTPAHAHRQQSAPPSTRTRRNQAA